MSKSNRNNPIRSGVEIVARRSPDWVILQFNQFSFGRWGLNPFLPLALARIKRRCGARLAVMFHEDFVPPINWKFRIFRLWQKWQFKQLGEIADIVMLSIDPWVCKYRSWFPGNPVRHLPVGSNVPRVPSTRDEARSRLNISAAKIVLGLFGAVHTTRNIPWLIAALQSAKKSNADVMVLYIGSDTARMRDLAGDIPLIAEGPLPAEEVSRRLSAVDVYMAPFIDGASTRRGSFMAALQHGLPTVATRGPLTDDVLLKEHDHALVLADVDFPEKFGSSVVSLISDTARRKRLSLAATALYDREFDWPILAKKLLNILDRENVPAIKPALTAGGESLDKLQDAPLAAQGTASK